MIALVLIKNPFDIHNRDIEQVEYSAVKTLQGYVLDTKITDAVKVAVNGRLIAEAEWPTTIPADGDNIVICPVIGKGGGGGKNVLGMVAAIALSVVSMGVGSAVSGGAMFGAGSVAMTSWTFAGYMAAAAVMYMGGTLLQNMSGSVAVDTSGTSGNYATSQTYSWDGAQTHASQGSPIPLTYGKVKITNNNVLSAHVTNDGEKQYLNLLLTSGEGEVDSISDITIAGNPISNYNDVVYETRLGTNEQPPIDIPTFSDSFADQSLSYELTTADWKTQQVDGNATQGLEITIEFPSGLYYANDQGGLSTTGVNFTSQYKLATDTDWKSFKDDYISAASSSAVRRVYRLDNLPAGSYMVRCMLSKKDGTGSRYANKCNWTQVSSIIPDRFSYPGMVLVALKALATSQLSGSSPAITWVQERKNVWVWNPYTAAYEQLAATNPAWICYDILHLCRKIKDTRTNQYVYDVSGCPANIIMYDDFKAWADECDRRGLVCNYFLDASGDLDAAFKSLEAAGRGKVVRRGTKYGCIYDHVATPVQMFSVGNINMSTFSIDYLAVEDRANAVEITFNNERKNYQRDTMIVYGDDYDASDTSKTPTQITLDAITDPDAIFREGKYYLRRNKYLVRTVTFDADVDAISSQVGDAILVQHDIPEWGFGGRIVSATGSTVKLDRSVSVEAGSQYEITVRLQDDTIVKRTITASTTEETDTLTVDTAFDVTPAQYDVYSFGKSGISTKPFTVISMSRTPDSQMTLECLEYNEAVYSEATDVPVIDYSQFESGKVHALQLTEVSYAQIDGTVKSSINVSWSGDRSIALYYNVYLSQDGKTYTKIAQVNGFSYSIENVAALTTYYVKVSAVDALQNESSAVSSLCIVGKDTPPSDVSFFSLNQADSDIVATIQQVSDYDIDHYEIRIGTDWNTAYKIGDFTGTSYSFAPTQNGTCTYLVKAFDTSGNESVNAKKQVINISNGAATNVIYSHRFDTSNYESYQNLYDHNTVLRMIDARKISDFEYFKDIFGQLTYLDGVIYLPVIDLGENIVDPISYWIDSKGVIHQQQIKKIKDYATFADIFAADKELVAPVSLASTFLNIAVNGTTDKDILKTIEYRVSIDGYTYTDWTPLIQTIFKGRYVQIRITVSSISTHTQCYIDSVDVRIDIPDVDISMENIDLIAGDNYVTYSHYFMETPSSIAPFTTDTNNKSVSYKILSMDSKGFHISLYDDNNNLTAGKITRVLVSGY